MGHLVRPIGEQKGRHFSGYNTQKSLFCKNLSWFKLDEMSICVLKLSLGGFLLRCIVTLDIFLIFLKIYQQLFIVVGEEKKCESKVYFYPNNITQRPNQDLTPRFIVRNSVYSQVMLSLIYGKWLIKDPSRYENSWWRMGWPHGMWAKPWIGR